MAGEPVDLTDRRPGAASQCLGDLHQSCRGRAAAVAELSASGRPSFLDPPHQARHRAHRLFQQVRIFGMVDVGLDDGGVDPHFAAAHHLAFDQLAQQRLVQLLPASALSRPTSLISVIGCGTGLTRAIRQNRRQLSESVTSRHNDS